ncbi:MAG: ABC transporter ATP-binding protein, partial [Lachnospiraceae bacterium]|nr:ABC transporter ATP-binding protein [Lachnospiraceae bacterium]
LGLIRFQEGEIKLLQKDAVKNRREVLSQIGYMPSEAMFYPTMKVKDVIAFAAEASSAGWAAVGAGTAGSAGERRRDCTEESERICELLKVDREKKIEELSLGNRKKVSIVCAMQHKPKLLILDEPTSGLDPLMQEAFFKLLLEYNSQGTTCFLSSHVISEVKRYCRNAAIIRDGAIIRVDTVENLSKSNLRRIKLTENKEVKDFAYTGSMKELLKELEGRNIEDLLIEEPSLEELFMHYYESEDKQV